MYSQTSQQQRTRWDQYELNWLYRKLSSSQRFKKYRKTNYWELEECPLLRGLLYCFPISECPLSVYILYIIGLGSYNDGHHPSTDYGHTLSPPLIPRPRRESQALTSVAVKVLRSVSSYLLPPLLHEACGEFTPRLLRDIIVAIQKISWKVEACLSFCNSIDTFAVHDEVFSEEVLTAEMKDVMVASPPEKMKIQNSPAHLGLREDQISLDADMEMYWEKQRRRDNSIGDVMSQESGKEGYFRPGRRTTVSISKRQVQSLGLNVVDATAPDSMSPKRSNTISNTKDVIDLDSEAYLSIRDRVLKKLAKEFPQFQTDDNENGESIPKRPSTLPVNSDSRILGPLIETRSSSAPLPPIDQRPIRHTHLRERHSHEPSSTILEEGLPDIDMRSERVKSERLRSVSPRRSPKHKDFSQSVTAEHNSPKTSTTSHTMPHKRRKTFVKMVKKKALSFGRADSKIKQRTPIYIRNKSTSEFFSPEEERTGSESPIEQFVLKAHPREASCKSSGMYTIVLCCIPV